MGYVHSFIFSRHWPPFDDRWALMDIAGNRVRFPEDAWYCHATPEAKRIWRELLELVRTLRVPPPCGVVTTSEVRAITGDAVRASIPVSMALDARSLRLDPSVSYPLRLLALHAGGPPTQPPLDVDGAAGPELKGQAIVSFALSSPSLAVLEVG